MNAKVKKKISLPCTTTFFNMNSVVKQYYRVSSCRQFCQHRKGKQVHLAFISRILFFFLSQRVYLLREVVVFCFHNCAAKYEDKFVLV